METPLQRIALKTIALESQSINDLSKFINDDFEKSIRAIEKIKGRLVVSGIGKSAIIAQKIVATFNSTGTPSIFLHAADAIHGDLGIIQEEDIVMIISKSGESPEIKVLVPLIKNFGFANHKKNILIGMVGNANSYLAQQSDIFLNTTIEQEACPNNLAPTCSTTAQLVMGDALAVCLMELKGFNSNDFAKFHPGGALGKKLYWRVADLYKNNETPCVFATQSLKEVIVEISSKRLGATAVVDDKNNLLGIITDGDLRRMLEKNNSLEKLTADMLMSENPKTVGANELAIEALDIMRKNSITQLAVTDNNKYLGFIHLHDLIREGLV
ncbi:MAG: KpsF/GutQ family sugar-phosphate isomerase [Chitinophagaceae bacterium]|nr:MAG: KpsF/GutQ family sugar-phosphate isomerase [Chitinophagaceae bacterium]